jgi:23S rRNA pseudouridine2605 synthase
MRLAKFLAHAGVASRRAAEEIIREGRVTVGGNTVTDPARGVDEHSGVEVDGRPVAIESERAVFALNKPRGVVSTARDTHGRRTVVSLVPSPKRLYPVGRLDANTTGLILLTDDGELAHHLTHPSFEVPKTYRVTLIDKQVTDRAVRELRQGVTLEDGRTAPARVRRAGEGVLEITIHEGRKRQVRRMIEAVGHKVSALERVAFGSLKLGSLRPGQVRRLTGAEVSALRTAGNPGNRRAPRSRRKD